MEEDFYNPARLKHFMQESADLLKKGLDDQATIPLKRALRLKLDVFSLGIVGLKKARSEMTAVVREFARIVIHNKTTTDLQIDFAHAVGAISIENWNENIENAVILCLKNPLINPQNLIGIGISLLNFKAFSTNDRLLLALMENVILPNERFEKYLIEKRKELLFHSQDKNFLENHLLFIYALAQQVYMNEYVYLISNEEKALANQLQKSVLSQLDGLGEQAKLRIVLLSCYCPLHSPCSILHSNSTPQLLQKLLAYAEGDPSFQRFLKIHYFDQKKEKELSWAISQFGNIEDDLSQKVKHQYEENPYPRWFRLDQVKPEPLKHILIRNFPYLEETGISWPDNPRVLVAGCGTGQHAISCSLKIHNCSVLGTDLSLSSLSYAKRQALELDINNIEFLQGDILDFEKCKERFDIIECSGVLHHMQAPFAGWKILKNLLTARGWMYIGLYSKLGRKKLSRAKQYVLENGYQANVEDIRNCRKNIMNMPQSDPIKSVTFWQDFYAMSSCRDLLFHVHEVEFTILEIEQMLNALEMEFLGFDLLSESTNSRFHKMFPDDPQMNSLKNWNEFEKAYPDTFSKMYQFWIRRVQLKEGCAPD